MRAAQLRASTTSSRQQQQKQQHSLDAHVHAHTRGFLFGGALHRALPLPRHRPAARSLTADAGTDAGTGTGACVSASRACAARRARQGPPCLPAHQGIREITCRGFRAASHQQHHRVACPARPCAPALPGAVRHPRNSTCRFRSYLLLLPLYSTACLIQEPGPLGSSHCVSCICETSLIGDFAGIDVLSSAMLSSMQPAIIPSRCCHRTQIPIICLCLVSRPPLTPPVYESTLATASRLGFYQVLLKSPGTRHVLCCRGQPSAPSSDVETLLHPHRHRQDFLLSRVRAAR